MTLPYASMQDDDDDPSNNKKTTSTALWRKWRPGSMVPSLKPRLNRRRRRSSTAFPTAEKEQATLKQDDVPSHEHEEEPSSPPTSTHVDQQEEITTPRTEQREAIAFDSTFSLTPPTASPAPLVVSAKRLGSEVRRNHSKRRKGRMWDDKENSTLNGWRRAENEMHDEPEEGLPPVEHLSPEERTQRYWQWCYGDNAEHPMPQNSWSASRAPPGKSCLSSKKEPPQASAAVTLETPTLDRLSSTGDNPSTVELPIQANAFETPSNTPPDAVVQKSAPSKSVQFGMASAAEYELDCPPKELTPMPSEVAKERFPLTMQEFPETKEATEETKHNSATLAEWDNDFDSYLSSDDDDDESSGEELESMLFSRKRKSRRNSGFFSPDTASLLLPAEDESVQEGEDCDLSTDVNMASLAVRSPLCENMEGKTVEISDGANKRLELSSPSSSSNMDTTPPSDVQLGTVHSTGGALAEANPRGGGEAPMISSRQLHGALERCAEDENDIVMMLMKNPSLEMEWSTEQLLRTMSRHRAINDESAQSTADPSDGVLEFLKSIKCPSSCIQKLLLTETERCILETPRAVEHQSLPTNSNLAAAVTSWESQKLELASLEKVLRQMREASANARRELTELETHCMSLRLVIKRQAGKEEEQVLALEQVVRDERAKRDLAVARLRHQEALCDLVRAAPYNIVQCLSLSNLASFSLESVSPARVDVSFSCAAEGPRPCSRWDAQGGTSTFVLPESSKIAERAPTIASDHVASVFYRAMLFVSDEAAEGLTIHPSILRHVLSNDFSQTVLSLSLLMGHMDLALADLLEVTTKSFVGNVSVDRKSELIVLLSIAFCDDLQVHFYYDSRSEKSLAHSIPSRVRVIQAGIRMESLESDAQQTLRAASTPCLARICDALFLASCI